MWMGSGHRAGHGFVAVHSFVSSAPFCNAIVALETSAADGAGG